MKNQVICLEDLNIKNITAIWRLSKPIERPVINNWQFVGGAPNSL